MIEIYEAGPIEGCTLEEATGWRTKIKTEFFEEIRAQQIKILNPMDGKMDVVNPGEIICPENYKLQKSHRPLITSQAIFARDIAMIDTADIILANFTASIGKIGIGTMFELGYGYAMGKMLVVIATEKRHLNHPFIRESTIVFNLLDDGITFIRSLVKSGCINLKERHNG